MAKEYLTESSRWCRHLSGGTTKAFATVLVCLGLIPSTVVGQQNLFNVPSSDITEPGEIFYQQQINLLPDLLQFNSTMCYGLGRNFEIGFNIIGLNVNTQSSSPLIISNGDIHSPPVYPFYTLNLQKAFVLNRTLRVAVGAQTGLSIDAHFGNYTYTNLITSIPRWHSKIITGIYGSTNSFLGPGDRNLFVPDANIGFQLGLEQPIIREKRDRRRYYGQTLPRFNHPGRCVVCVEALGCIARLLVCQFRKPGGELIYYRAHLCSFNRMA